MTENSDFKNGSLVRLLLRDFMTYKKVELNAGPNLNLILGPNGTGKSALVCGIIIGLGGDVTTTGRSGHLGEYIRFGCDSALIEIELFNEKTNQKNFLIQRHINATRSRSGKVEFNSTFKLNAKESNRTNIREFVKSLDINVDNLCQFLPQERVIEFVKMDRKTLLECTEKAAGDIDMFDSHKQVVELTKAIKRINDCNLDLNNQISTETELQTRAQEELKRIEERDKFKDEIQWLKKKRPWLEYEDKRLEYMTAKEDTIQKKDQIKQVLATLDPLKLEVTESRAALLKNENNKRKAMEALKSSAKLIEPVKTNLELCYEKIIDAKNGYFEVLDQENKRKSRLTQLENELTLLEEEYQNISEDMDVEDKIKAVQQELTAANAESLQFSQQRMKLKNQYETLVIEKNQLETTMKRIGNIFNKRLDKLSELNSNARKAYEWLTRNKDKFSSEIYPPIMTQINMKRPENAKYVESAVSKNDLMAFICESSEDLKLFTDLLKNELNIRVNVVLAPNEDEDHFKPNIDIKNYSNFGLHSYVKDMFSAPNKVMAYLCKTARLHCIPVGNNRTDSMIEELIDSSEFRRIYTEKNVYNIAVSRYDKEKVIRSDSFPEAKFLNLVIDDKLMKETELKISKISETINNVKSETQKIDESLSQLKTKSEDLLKKKRMLDNQKNERKILETKIGGKKDQIARNESSAVDPNVAKNIANDKLKELEEKQLKLLNKLNNNISECVKKNDDKLKAVLIENLSKTRLKNAEQKFSNASIQFQDLKNDLKRLENSLNDLKNEAKRLRDVAKQESGFDVNANNDTELREKFDSMPNSIEEIDNKIGTLELRMNSILDADESVRESYNKRQKEIEKRRRDLEIKRIELRDKQTKLESVKNRWIASLEELIAKINSNFGQFMARLNCAGEVSLYKGNDEDSYDEYGISIKVKFRHTEQLKELTSFHQSGGERSVSTMIYMIALQELSHVPFRCVDEINQGMDESNERSVFDLISESSGRNSSQYFLFSPKLLTDLSYTEKMKIHIIFNGPFMEFDWSRIGYQSDDEMESDADDDDQSS